MIHGFEADEVALGFDSKVAEGVADFQALRFAVGERGGQKVIDLRGHGFSGRLVQGSMLFERLMKFSTFHRLWQIVVTWVQSRLVLLLTSCNILRLPSLLVKAWRTTSRAKLATWPSP